MLKQTTSSKDERSEEKKFTHSVTERIELPQPLSLDTLQKIFMQPYYFEIIYYKLALFYKKDGTKFAEGEQIKEGDEFYLSIPLIDGKEKSLYKCTTVELGAGLTKIVNKTIEPAPMAPPDAQFTVVYRAGNTNRNTLPSFEATLDDNPKDPNFMSVAQVMFKQMLHRIYNLAIDTERVLREYKLAGTVDIETDNKASFHGLPYSLGTAIDINCDADSLFKLFNKPLFIDKILHKTGEEIESKKLKHGNVLREKDEFIVNMDNIITTLEKFHLKTTSITEEVTYTLLKCDEKTKTIELISNSGINNFHQFGMRFVVESKDSSASIVQINVYHHHDNKVAFASTAFNAAKTIGGFFSSGPKGPSPSVFLDIRMRNMIDAITRHLYRYVYEEANGVDIKPHINSSNRNRNSY